ncbi:MAG: BTAD domain-containing putative transcriptional regulator [Actinoplanes sp.]
MTRTGPDRVVAHLRLLDDFALEVDGRPVDPPASGQRLLAYLALHGATPRSVLAGTLWGEVAEERAYGSLRTTVWRLNQVVPGLVTVKQPRLQLASFISTDVAQFVDRATSRLDGPAASMAATDVRVHELLPGWYDEWVVFERERLRQLSLHMVEHAAQQLCLAGRYAIALDLALAAVRGEPLRESAHRTVIEVHLAEGNIGEALRNYHRFRRLLADQLGVAPSPALLKLITEAGVTPGAALTPGRAGHI